MPLSHSVFYSIIVTPMLRDSSIKKRTFIRSYSNLALYKAGDVIAGVKNRECPHDVLLQPVPVLNNLLLGDT